MSQAYNKLLKACDIFIFIFLSFLFSDKNKFRF